MFHGIIQEQMLFKGMSSHCILKFEKLTKGVRDCLQGFVNRLLSMHVILLLNSSKFIGSFATGYGNTRKIRIGFDLYLQSLPMAK